MRYPVNYIWISQGFTNSHKGIDLGYKKDAEDKKDGGKNAPVYAVDDGVVIYRYKQASGGNVLHIKHSNGYVSEYGHLDEFKVKLNQKVKVGEIIGIMGCTGKVTGNHLHFGLYKGSKINYSDKSKFVDPTKYLCVFKNQSLNSSTKDKYQIFKSKIAQGIPKSEIGNAMYIRKNNGAIVGKISNGEETAYYGKYGKNKALAVVDNINLHTTLDGYLK